MNIATTKNGFKFDGIEYKFNDDLKTEIVSEFQLFAFTDKGIILLDKSCTIDDVVYDEINTFENELIKNQIK